MSCGRCCRCPAFVVRSHCYPRLKYLKWIPAQVRVTRYHISCLYTVYTCIYIYIHIHILFQHEAFQYLPWHYPTHPPGTKDAAPIFACLLCASAQNPVVVRALWVEPRHWVNAGWVSLWHPATAGDCWVQLGKGLTRRLSKSLANHGNQAAHPLSIEAGNFLVASRVWTKIPRFRRI